MSVSLIGENKVITELRKMVANGIATYTTPTTDHNFKKVFCNNDEIGHLLGDVILTISMPGRELSARKVEVMSENVEAVFKNFQLLLRDIHEQQNTKVDVLLCGDVNDGRREDRVMQTKRETIIQKPAYFLCEMQVKEQNLGIRLISYISKIMSSALIDLEKNRIPPPVYGVGICMWGDNQPLIKGALVFSSRDMDVDSETKQFTEMIGHNIFLGKLREISKIAVKDEITRDKINQLLDSCLKDLKKRVIQYFKKVELENQGEGIDFENSQTLDLWFEKLSMKEKVVYLFLQFIAYAHLMDEAHINESLGCLEGAALNYNGNEIELANIFRKAYSILKFNIVNEDMDENTINQIKNDYPDIWGFGKIFAEESQRRAEEAEKAGVDSTVRLIRRTIREDNTKEYVKNIINDIDESLRVPVARKLLDEREASPIPQVLQKRAEKVINKAQNKQDEANQVINEAPNNQIER